MATGLVLSLCHTHIKFTGCFEKGWSDDDERRERARLGRERAAERDWE